MRTRARASSARPHACAPVSASALDAEERDIAAVRDFFTLRGPGGEIVADPSYRSPRGPSADPKELLEELLFERKRNRGIEQDRTAFIARFTFSLSLSTALPNATTYGFLPREVARTALSDGITHMAGLTQAPNETVEAVRAAAERLVTSQRLLFGAMGGDKNDCNERTPLLAFLDPRAKAATPLQLKICRAR